MTVTTPLTSPLTTIGDLAVDGSPPRSDWWRSAVLYQVYPRSFADSDGDGIGDLPGITARLPYLRDLGVDGVWVSPFYRSPMADAGYDVADYRTIDPLFGTLADADALVHAAHDLGLKVLIDLVPNHTSDEHEWFVAALAAAPGSPERERYIFRDGLGVDGAEPPNNWRSVFGGIAWTRVLGADGRPGQWYLHIFDTKQPDLNWDNPLVRDEFIDILRFWLDRGVDGFRVDVAHGLVKAPGLPDFAVAQELLGAIPGAGDDSLEARAPMWDQDGVHEVYQRWRQVLDSYGEPARVMCAEAWVEPVSRAMRYLRADEFHQSFNFAYLEAPWRAEDLREVISGSLESVGTVGASATWVLSNHDVVRHASRLGFPVGTARPHGIAAGDPQPDAAIGLRRARAATTVMLALPGAAYVYQGEELGLPEHTALPHEVRQDPAFHRTAGEEIGRDGCRIPMPWVGDAPSLGFGPTTQTWLPQSHEYADLAVDRQTSVPGSTLELYRELLAHRRDLRLGEGRLTWGPLNSTRVLDFAVTAPGGTTRVIVNFGPTSIDVPAGALVQAVSDSTAGATTIGVDTAVWLKTSE